MDNLPFVNEEYDVIWSESAIYNIGFEKGITNWHRYLKVGGLLVVSEITWITDSRPPELQKYWASEYPEIDVASLKIAVLERNGLFLYQISIDLEKREITGHRLPYGVQ